MLHIHKPFGCLVLLPDRKSSSSSCVNSTAFPDNMPWLSDAKKEKRILYFVSKWQNLVLMTNSCVFRVHASLSLPLFYKTCCKSDKAAVANLCALIQCAFLCHIYLWMFCCRYRTSNSWIAEPRQNISRNSTLEIPQNLHVKHRLLKNTDIWTCISIIWKSCVGTILIFDFCSIANYYWWYISSCFLKLSLVLYDLLQIPQSRGGKFTCLDSMCFFMSLTSLDDLLQILHIQWLAWCASSKYLTQLDIRYSSNSSCESETQFPEERKYVCNP